MLALVDVPETRYAKSGDLHIAYQVTRGGPPDIVFPTTLWSPLDLLWEDPLAARGLRRLASMGRLVGCDLRGWGSSDTVDLAALPALQAWMDDLGVVMDEAGSERVVLIGAGEVGLVAILFAATYPDRVSGLVLINSFARFRRGPDQPWAMPTDAAERYLRLYLAATGRGSVADLLAPSRAGESGFRRWFGKCERLSAGPRASFMIYSLFQASDVTVALSSITAPTLVLHTIRNPHVHSSHAELLAERIPHAKLVMLPGDDHVWYAGEVEALFDHIEAFVTGAPAAVSGTRLLTTVLFTDVVGSTERAAPLCQCPARRSPSRNQ